MVVGHDFHCEPEREGEREREGASERVTPLSCDVQPPPELGSGAEISSVLCPQGHPSVDHKTVLDS